jgi:hypothetical protein
MPIDQHQSLWAITWQEGASNLSVAATMALISTRTAKPIYLMSSVLGPRLPYNWMTALRCLTQRSSGPAMSPDNTRFGYKKGQDQSSADRAGDMPDPPWLANIAACTCLAFFVTNAAGGSVPRAHELVRGGCG